MKFARIPTLVIPALLLLHPVGARAADCTGPPANEPSIRAEWHAGLMTLEARNARLSAVLEHMGRLAGFTTRRFSAAPDCSSINVTLERVPLIEAIERLVASSNRIVFYGPGDASNPRGAISQVWLLGSSDVDVALYPAADEAPADDGLEQEDPARRSEAVLKLSRRVSIGAEGDEGGAVLLARMGQVLQQDPDPLVRSRAAIALGALGEPAAVGDLEAALADAHFSVRSQAIGALGRIDDDRASTALGGILLDPGVDTVERVMAARALWQQGSDTARAYLQLGAGDGDPQVREAASNAPTDTSSEPAAATAEPAAATGEAEKLE